MPTLQRWASNASTTSRPASRQSSRPGTPLPQHDDGHAEERGQAQAAQDKPTLRSRLFGRRTNSNSSNAGAQAMSQRNTESATGIALRPMTSAPASGPRPAPTITVDPPASTSPSTSPTTGLDLSRTQSINRTIRFAPELAPSSDTAPGPAQGLGVSTGSPASPSGGSSSNYGNAQSGFKRTPGLAMFRSTSIKEDER